jgi:hypothetical protein
VALGSVLIVGLAFIVVGRLTHPEHPPSVRRVTCFVTGGGELRVRHETAAEGVYYHPPAAQLGYNTQIIEVGAGYATMVHSEPQDSASYRARTGRARIGDSIKSGVMDRPTDSDAVHHAPANLDFRLWGSLTNPRSPLYYAIDPHDPAALGFSGGANPMTVAGSDAVGDPYFYVLFLGVASDAGAGTAWRNVLLEARTRDFLEFDVLEDRAGRSEWAAFAGDRAMPAVLRDVGGQPIVSNQTAPVEDGKSKDPMHPAGAVVTAGLFGSVVKYEDLYYYFYPDQDPKDPRTNHLYVRTAKSLASNGQLSEPRVVLDVPPEIMFRVAKAHDMNRWAILYNCLRSVQPLVLDICLQYTANMNIGGDGGLGSLVLYDGPPVTGRSHYALGLVGGDKNFDSGQFLKIQHYYLTDRDGNLAVPRMRSEPLGGLLTWTDLSRDLQILGADTYWAEWQVTPATTNDPKCSSKNL